MAFAFFRRPVFRTVWKWLWRISLGFVFISLLWVFLLKWVNPGTTLLMLSRKMSATDPRFEIQKEWVPIEQISRNMQLAAICGEDQRFCQHYGFDLQAIRAAVKNNASGGRLRGASTISQQTAKNVFLWEGRSWLRKGLEVWFTALIELIWGKQRIMEVYLNVIETGNGTFGVEAAARRYYKTSAARLSAAQAARISGLLPCPRTCGLFSGFTSQRTQIILYAMNRYGIQLEYLK